VNHPTVLQTIKPTTVSAEHIFYCGGIKPTYMYTFVPLNKPSPSDDGWNMNMYMGFTPQQHNLCSSRHNK